MGVLVFATLVSFSHAAWVVSYHGSRLRLEWLLGLCLYVICACFARTIENRARRAYLRVLPRWAWIIGAVVTGLGGAVLMIGFSVVAGNGLLRLGLIYDWHWLEGAILILRHELSTCAIYLVASTGWALFGLVASTWQKGS